METIGSIRFYSRDCGEELTIDEFLKTLAWGCWQEQVNDIFLNSYWKEDIEEALIKNGIMIRNSDYPSLDYIIQRVIANMESSY